MRHSVICHLRKLSKRFTLLLLLTKWQLQQNTFWTLKFKTTLGMDEWSPGRFQAPCIPWSCHIIPRVGWKDVILLFKPLLSKIHPLVSKHNPVDVYCFIIVPCLIMFYSTFVILSLPQVTISLCRRGQRSGTLFVYMFLFER